MPSGNGNDSQLLSSLDNDLQALNTFMENFSDKYQISYDQLLEQLRKMQQGSSKPVLIPSSILREKKLGILEAVTKYFKEVLSLSYHQIAILLKRDDRVVWTTYNRAIKKKPDGLLIKEPNVWLPVSIFTNSLGPMEAITLYLHDKLNLTFNEIAKLIDRDNRSIWACYHKAKKKDEESKKQ